jgi:hypothetical protein
MRNLGTGPAVSRDIEMTAGSRLLPWCPSLQRVINQMIKLQQFSFVCAPSIIQ